MFKVGDKVRHCHTGNVYRVNYADDTHISVDNYGGRYWAKYYTLVSEENHHKWHDVICAWAKGAKIQFRLKDSDGLWHEWLDVKNPSWFGYGYESEYRIKPDPKPDVGVFMQLDEYGASPSRLPSNIKATFDGDTGKLKDVEILK
jgi:hypothetical protein